MKQTNDTSITIATYSTDWEAHIAEGVLSNEGIPCTLTNETFSSIYPIGTARRLLDLTAQEDSPES